MEISRATVGTLTALCLAAGAAGGYLATRGTEQPEVIAGNALSVPQADPRGATSALESTQSPTAQPAPIARPRTGADRRPPESPSRSVRQLERVDPPTPPEIDSVGAVALLSPEPPGSEPPPEPTLLSASEPPEPEFEELVVVEESVVGLQMETSLTSDRARVEDTVVARVTRDVRVGDRTAIPAGARAYGEVTMVERGGRMRERARLGIRFTEIVLAGGIRVPIETDVVYREGEPPGRESAAKIGGGAIGGAIIGGLLGGAKGAILGGTAGAGAGTAAALSGGRNPAMLPAGANVTVRLLEPATVTVER
jgi:hypothetical protein